jgi:filamentous hemagglutinin family protein
MVMQAPSKIHFGRRWRGFSGLHRVLCGLLASLQILVPSLAAALPSDGKVVGGSATIQQSNPKTLNIQQATDKAILNWKSFSIAADEAVRFVQPSINSIALNRVTGIDPSVILGSLQANGRIFLINPNGILFGAGAQINVGGLLATTLQIRDDDFMAGRYLFAQDPLKSLKSIVNEGTIRVSDHGFVVLAAPGVTNDGLIVANLGKVVLGSGQKLAVDLMGDGLNNYNLSGKVLDQVKDTEGKPLSSAVSNSGTIQADGGHVILQAKASGDIFSSVVNQSGVVRARSLVNQEGIVRLDGGDSGVVQVAGTIDASGLLSGHRAR